MKTRFQTHTTTTRIYFLKEFSDVKKVLGSPSLVQGLEYVVIASDNSYPIKGLTSKRKHDSFFSCFIFTSPIPGK